MKKGKEIVIHSNRFSAYKYELKKYDWQLLIAAISQIKPDSSPKTMFKLSKEEVLRLTKIDEDNWNKVSFATVDNLIKLTVSEKVEASSGVAYEARTVFSKIKYTDGELSFRFSPDIYDDLFALRQKFKQYSLSDAMKLSTPQIAKLFVWMKNYEKMEKEVEVTIEDLMDITGASLELRSRPNSFLPRVIDKAKEDFEKHNMPLDFTYWKRKGAHGRIVSLVFSIFPPEYEDE